MDNKIYLKEILDCQKSGELSPELIEMNHNIATRLVNKPNFRGFNFHDEMISDAFTMINNYILKFNLENSDNPFAYAMTLAKSYCTETFQLMELFVLQQQRMLLMISCYTKLLLRKRYARLS